MHLFHFKEVYLAGTPIIHNVVYLSNQVPQFPAWLALIHTHLQAKLAADWLKWLKVLMWEFPHAMFNSTSELLRSIIRTRE